MFLGQLGGALLIRDGGVILMTTRRTRNDV